jgi:hypothetical protein
MAAQLDVGLNAGGVAGRSEALEVEYASTVELVQDEPATAGRVFGLDLLCDIGRRA